MPSVAISILGKEITPVPVARDLGVFIDQYLTYDEHLTQTAAKCLCKLVQINRIKHLLDKETLLLLINAFVFSKLFYCSTVFSNTSKSSVRKLQRVQNFAARIILGLRKFDYISQGIKSLKWLPVKDRLYLNDAIMMYKCINKLAPDYLADKFVQRSHIHNRNTRSRNQFRHSSLSYIDWTKVLRLSWNSTVELLKLRCKNCQMSQSFQAPID